MNGARYACMCLLAFAVACSASPDRAIVAGRYSGVVDGVPLYMDVRGDGTYYRWWIAESGFSVVKIWHLNESSSGAVIATFVDVGGSSMSFVVRDSGNRLELVDKQVSGVLRRTKRSGSASPSSSEVFYSKAASEFLQWSQ